MEDPKLKNTEKNICQGDWYRKGIGFGYGWTNIYFISKDEEYILGGLGGEDGQDG